MGGLCSKARGNDTRCDESLANETELDRVNHDDNLSPHIYRIEPVREGLQQV